MMQLRILASYLAYSILINCGYGQTTTNPQVLNSVYANVSAAGQHTCEAAKANLLEAVYLKSQCGTMLSPCYPSNYTKEITEGFKIWYIDYPEPIAAVRLLLNVFETNGVNGVLYIGQSLTVVGSAYGVTREYEIYGSVTNQTGNPLTVIQSPSSNLTTVSHNTYIVENVRTLFFSFYTSLEPVDIGFNISYCVDVDRCQSTSPYCKNGGTCMRTGFETYSCLCPASLTGAQCEGDIDECLVTTSCDTNANCNNTVGSFSCDCKTGWTGTGVGAGSCTDINECAATPFPCYPTSSGGNCTNLPGNFSCSCKAGYSGDGINCSDINECATNNGGCGNVTTSTCTNTNGSYACGCSTGFSGSPCMDIDECVSTTPACHSNATCTNSVGSFSCRCKTGYTGDGLACTDIDECGTTGTCDTNATCNNTAGSFACTCKTGYTGTGLPGMCNDLDECSTSPPPCDINAVCNNSIASFSCACKTGYTGDGFNCTDKNECILRTDDCNNTTETCSNTPGSFQCLCNSPAYRGISPNCSGYYCPGVLSSSTQCIIDGFIEWPTYQNTTYLVNQDVTWVINFTATTASAITFTIKNIDVETEQDYIIFNDVNTYRNLTPVPIIVTGQGGSVFNGNVSASDTNLPGYNVTTKTFTINRNWVYVHFHSDRQNTFTGFQIQYSQGVDQCTVNPCKNGGTCSTNFVGFTCTNCPGWSGRECEVDINECTDKTDNCDTNALCVNTEGSFTCICNSGYTGAGTTGTCKPYIVVSNLEFTTFTDPSGVVSMVVTFDVSSMWKSNLSYIQNYNINYTAGSTNIIKTAFVNESSFNNVTISPIVAFTAYTVSISVGDTGSLFTNAVVNITNTSITSVSAETIPLAPTGLNTTTVTSLRTAITWVAPAEAERGATVGYQIGTQRTASDCATFSFIQDTLDCGSETLYDISVANFNKTTYVLTNLISYRHYNIRVRAKTVAGYGNWSTVFVVFTGSECPPYDTAAVANVSACTFDSAALKSANFPNAYPDFSQLFWLIDHENEDIRFTLDIFMTQDEQDHLDFGVGYFPSDNPSFSYVNKSFSGNLTNTAPAFNFTSAETGGKTWVRFNSDIFTDLPGFLIHYDTGVNRCLTNPCLLGGTCSSLPFDFSCSCPSFWAGKVCNKPQVQVVVTCTTSASNNAIVSWTVQSEKNNHDSLIKEYKVTHSGASVSETTSVYPPGTTSTNLTGFTPYEAYTVIVEIVAISPATVATSATCSGRSAEAAPTAPTLTSVATFNATAIVLQWTAPGTLNGVLANYTITYSAGGVSNTVTVGATEVSATISGLTAYTNYSVSIIATTGGGSGAASGTLTATTNEIAPSGSVRNLTIVPTATVVAVSYIPPVVVTGVFSYDISYYRTSNGPTSAITITETGTSSNSSSLTPFTNYTITVTVKTSAGLGIPISRTFMTLTAIPGNVGISSITPSTNSLRVVWTAPVAPNGLLTGYRVTWEGGDSNQLPVTSLSYDITSLTAYTTYNVVVRASTSAGENSGVTQVARTSEAVPSGPVRSITSATNSTSVTISFLPPTVITGSFQYDVTYTEGGILKTSSNNSGSPIVIKLSPATTYSMSIYAKTSAGNGPISTISVTTADSISSEVTNVATSMNATYVKINWASPATPNGVVWYRLTWSMVGSTTSLMSDNVTSLSYVLSNLQPFTSYVITVFAVTSAGQNTGVATTVTTDATITDPPELKLSLNSNNTITVTIVPVIPPKGNVLQNIVSIKQNNTECLAANDPSCYTISKSLNAGILSFTTDVLPAYRHINFQATSRSSLGSSSESRVFSQLTNPGVPDVVTNVVVNAVNQTSIQVNWTSSIPVPGPSSYNITLTPSGTGGSSRMIYYVVTTLTSNQTYTVTGLQAGYGYSVSIIQSTSAGTGISSLGVFLPREANVIPGAAPSISTSQSFTGASRTHAFAINNPCLSNESYFLLNSGQPLSIEVIVKEASSVVSDIGTWAANIDMAVIAPFQAATIICTTNRNKRSLTTDNSSFIVGYDATCNKSLTTEVCNGQLKADRSYQVAIRANTGSNNDPSNITAYSSPISTTALATTTSPTTTAAPVSGLSGGEIAAIVICSIIVLLLIILLIYFCYRRKRGGKYSASKASHQGGVDDDMFDDADKQRYRVDPSVPASTSYTSETGAGPAAQPGV